MSRQAARGSYRPKRDKGNTVRFLAAQDGEDFALESKTPQPRPSAVDTDAKQESTPKQLPAPPTIIRSQLTQAQRTTLERLFGGAFASGGPRHDGHAVLAHVRRTSEATILDEMQALAPVSSMIIHGGNPARTTSRAYVHHCLEDQTPRDMVARHLRRAVVVPHPRTCYHSPATCSCVPTPDTILLSMTYGHTPEAIANMVRRTKLGYVRWLMHPMFLAKGNIANELFYEKRVIDGESMLVGTICGTSGVFQQKDHDWLTHPGSRHHLGDIDLVWSAEMHHREPCPTFVYTFILAERVDDKSPERFPDMRETLSDYTSTSPIPTKDPLLKAFTQVTSANVLKAQSFGCFTYVYTSQKTFVLPKRAIHEVARCVSGRARTPELYQAMLNHCRQHLTRYDMELCEQQDAIVPCTVLGFYLNIKDELALTSAMVADYKVMSDKYNEAVKFIPARTFDPSAMVTALHHPSWVPMGVINFARKCWKKLGASWRAWTNHLNSPAAMLFVCSSAGLAYAIYTRNLRLARHSSKTMLFVVAAIGVVAPSYVTHRWAKSTYNEHQDLIAKGKFPHEAVPGIYKIAGDLDTTTSQVKPVEVDAKSTLTPSNLDALPTDKPDVRVSGINVNKIATVPSQNVQNATRAIEGRVFAPVKQTPLSGRFRSFIELNVKDLLAEDSGVIMYPYAKDEHTFDILFKCYVDELPAPQRELLVKAREELVGKNYGRDEILTLLEHKAALKREKHTNNDPTGRVVQACDARINVMLAPHVRCLQKHLAKVWHKHSPIFFASGARAEDVGQWVTDTTMREMHILKQDVSKCDATYTPELIDCLMVVVRHYFQHMTYSPGTEFTPANLQHMQLLYCVGTIFDMKYRSHPQLSSGLSITTVFNTMRVALTNLFLYVESRGIAYAGFYDRLCAETKYQYSLIPFFDSDYKSPVPTKGNAELYRTMVLGDDSLVGHYGDKLDMDATGLHTDLKSEVCARASDIRFCSKMFYPVHSVNGDMLLPGVIIGRFFTNFGVQHSKPLQPTPEFIRGVALGLIQDNRHVPIVGEIITRVLQLTEGVSAKVIHEQYQFHTSRCYTANDYTWEYVAGHYDTTVEAMRGICELVEMADLGNIIVSPAAEPFINEVNTKDVHSSFEYDVKNQGNTPVEPAFYHSDIATALGSIAPSVERRTRFANGVDTPVSPMVSASANLTCSVDADGVITQCIVSPIFEEYVKHYGDTDKERLGAALGIAICEAVQRPKGAVYRAAMHSAWALLPVEQATGLHVAHNAAVVAMRRSPVFGLVGLTATVYTTIGLLLHKCQPSWAVAVLNEVRRQPLLAVAFAFSTVAGLASALGNRNNATASIFTRRKVRPERRRRDHRLKLAPLALSALRHSKAAFSLRLTTPKSGEFSGVETQATEEAYLRLLSYITPRYGRYGGPGNPVNNGEPVDKLDAAFKRHDEQYSEHQYAKADVDLVAELRHLRETNQLPDSKYAKAYSWAAETYFDTINNMRGRPGKQSSAPALAAPAARARTPKPILKRSTSRRPRASTPGPQRRAKTPSMPRAPPAAPQQRTTALMRLANASRSVPRATMIPLRGSNRDLVNGRNMSTVIFSGTDRLLDISQGSGGTTKAIGDMVANVPINPTNLPNCPRLNAFAKLFARYQILEMHAEITPKNNPDCIGTWLAYFDPDPNDNPDDFPPESRPYIATNHKGAVEGVWWGDRDGKPYIVRAPSKPDLLYCDFTGLDKLLTTAYRLVIVSTASAGLLASSALLSVTIKCTIRFWDPTIEPSFAPTPIGTFDIRANGTGTMTAVAPWGTTGGVKATGSAAFFYTATATTYTGGSNSVVGTVGATFSISDNGKYFVYAEYSGSTLVSTDPTANGTHSVQVLRRVVNAAGSEAAVLFYVSVTGQAVGTTFSTAGNGVYAPLSSAASVSGFSLRVFRCSTTITKKLDAISAFIDRAIKRREEPKLVEWGDELKQPNPATAPEPDDEKEEFMSVNQNSPVHRPVATKGPQSGRALVAQLSKAFL